MIILEFLLFIFIAILFLILVLLLSLVFIPFFCKSTLIRDEEFEATIDISWLWGIFGLQLVFLPQKKFISPMLFKSKIAVFPIKPKSPEAKKEKALKRAERKARKKEKKKKKRPPLEKQLEQVIATTQTLSLEALREVMVLLSSFFSSLKLRLSGEAEAGLSNPADTGMLLGIFYAAREIFNITGFKFYPNWEESTLKGNITLYGRVWIADILRIAIKTMFTPSIRRIWWPKVKEKLKFLSRVKPHAIER